MWLRSKRGRRHVVAALLSAVLLSGCALLAPLPEETSLSERLDLLPTTGLPLDASVTIRWDDHQIPFIDAQTDGDAAFALGLVHAHLRLGQMAILKRIAQGRIAEMGGPLAADIDHGLRILNYDRAVPAIETSLPPTTRAWIARFVDGINTYQDRIERLPVEYGILGLEREAWTVADVLTFGRLSGTDVNWLVWFALLQLRDRDDWPQIWARLVEIGGDSVPSFGVDPDLAAFGALLANHSRSGSNSVVVAPERTAAGAALIANDPHLGITIPNLWLVAGLKSPSYHAVGLMVPGLPIFAIGRNPWIAWGGTNMRALSSDLVDVSGLPEDQVRTRRETLRIRWWPDRDVVVRETAYGPILSDAPQLDEAGGPPFALRWTGHRVSDEITSFLGVSRARTFAAFHGAFAAFAVPGQNMLYADRDGNIAQVMAVALPERELNPPDRLLQQPETVDAAWAELRGAQALPYSLNPPQGFLASANNRPTADPPVPVGYFFSPDDRVVRMSELVGGEDTVDVEDLQRLQQDVYMASAVALRDVVVDKLEELRVAAEASPAERQAIDLLAAWDGHFRPTSREALAFELFRSAFIPSFAEARFGKEDAGSFAESASMQSLLLNEIRKATSQELAPPLRKGLAAAAGDLGAFDGWGSMHRLSLRHPLAFLPVIGRRFRFADYPIGGSNHTLMKTAHGTTDEKHTASYGQNARHISDLSDMDRNYFVLLGGQDGWINSSTFLDQVPLWLSGEYVQVPLRPETVRQRFPHRTELDPREPG